jgi:hypothetical protein
VLSLALICLSTNLRPILLYRLPSVIYLPLCKPIVLQLGFNLTLIASTYSIISLIYIILVIYTVYPTCLSIIDTLIFSLFYSLFFSLFSILNTVALYKNY